MARAARAQSRMKAPRSLNARRCLHPEDALISPAALCSRPLGSAPAFTHAMALSMRMDLICSMASGIARCSTAFSSSFGGRLSESSMPLAG